MQKAEKWFLTFLQISRYRSDMNSYAKNKNIYKRNHHTRFVNRLIKCKTQWSWIFFNWQIIVTIQIICACKYGVMKNFYSEQNALRLGSPIKINYLQINAWIIAFQKFKKNKFVIWNMISNTWRVVLQVIQWVHFNYLPWKTLKNYVWFVKSLFIYSFINIKESD